MDCGRRKLQKQKNGVDCDLGVRPSRIRRSLELGCRKGKFQIRRAAGRSVVRGFGAGCNRQQGLAESRGSRCSPAQPISSACWLETSCTDHPQGRRARKSAGRSCFNTCAQRDCEQEPCRRFQILWGEILNIRFHEPIRLEERRQCRQGNGYRFRPGLDAAEHACIEVDGQSVLHGGAGAGNAASSCAR